MATKNRQPQKRQSQPQLKRFPPKKDAAKSLDDLLEDSLKDALWAQRGSSQND